jgi:hypothetical protein
VLVLVQVQRPKNAPEAQGEFGQTLFCANYREMESEWLRTQGCAIIIGNEWSARRHEEENKDRRKKGDAVATPQTCVGWVGCLEVNFLYY